MARQSATPLFLPTRTAIRSNCRSGRRWTQASPGRRRKRRGGEPLILTPIPPELLDAALDRFAAGLVDPAARAAFARIRRTSPERAEGTAAEAHRLQTLELARACGMRVHPPGTRPGFNWDGAALDGDTEAYVILHEIPLSLPPPPGAPPIGRRRLPDFGLGPGPDT